MARWKDIDEEIDHYLQTLKEWYYDTDPAKVEDSEIVKHQIAQIAIEKFWYVQGRLLCWAQAHLTGYSILMENPELVAFLEEKLGHELDEDSHELEQIGLLYVYNPPDRDDPELKRMEALLEEFADLYMDEEEEFLSKPAKRILIRELLMSRCANNSYWRFELQQSLEALNEGEVPPLLTPSPVKRQGLPYSLRRWKLDALRQVRFRVGKGIKKYRALEEVGQAIGQSPETLRTWEKDLEKSPDHAVDLYCSEMAGIFDAHYSGDPEAAEPGDEYFGLWRGLNNNDHAKYLHRCILDTKLDDIRDAIRTYREKNGG